jgi:saccharopine dehydrogenase (NAD+, L-lysine-forming)
MWLWVRGEERPTERRAPIVPADARALVGAGVRITVEDAPRRVFPIGAYADAGCAVAPPGSWVDADPDVVVVGLKELPAEPAALRHRHVLFGHAFMGQPGAPELLRRFAAGGGTLLDLEYLVDDRGRRLAAFGHWAGYTGAALAVLALRGRLPVPLEPGSRAELDARLRPEPGDDRPTVLVIGARGRSGRGAQAALAVAGLTPTTWDTADTVPLDRPALLGHDALVNVVFNTQPRPAFVRPEDLDDPGRRLRLICDVTCDVGAPENLLPIYDTVTEWKHPVRRLRAEPVLDLIAIDNLPSLLPAEASTAFSADLRPLLLTLDDGAPWRRARGTYDDALAAMDLAIPPKLSDPGTTVASPT